MKWSDVPLITHDKYAVFRWCDDPRHRPMLECDTYRAEEGEGCDEMRCLTTIPFCVDIGVSDMIARLFVVGC